MTTSSFAMRPGTETLLPPAGSSTAEAGPLLPAAPAVVGEAPAPREALALAQFTDAEARAALSRYEETVRALAHRFCRQAAVGGALDFEDLLAEGRVAVLEALATYRGYGITEHTWVRTRIRQRIIDAIRRLDLRTRDETRAAMRHAAGVETDPERAELARLVAARRVVSADAPTADGEPLTARLEDTQTPRADEQIDLRRRGLRLAKAIEALPPRQRDALELGLLEGLPLREIGDRLGITESRVCQLQKRAVEHLHRAVTAAERDHAAAA
jgi:RNA polymerase sigma factor for flagellar operon FliA